MDYAATERSAGYMCGKVGGWRIYSKKRVKDEILKQVQDDNKDEIPD